LRFSRHWEDIQHTDTFAGGPGGFGVKQVLTGGKDVQRIIDSVIDPFSISTHLLDSMPKYFDIIRFNPGGINNTTPQLSCFLNSYDRSVWKIQSDAEGILGTDSSFIFKWASAIAFGEGCSKTAEETEIGLFMNTPSVVQDMGRLLKRSGNGEIFNHIHRFYPMVILGREARYFTGESGDKARRNSCFGDFYTVRLLEPRLLQCILIVLVGWC
jgi:hypothetical protein